MSPIPPHCWSQPHSLGDDRIVEQGIPALLDLPKGEAAAELHTQVDRCQVVGLQDPRAVCSSLRAGKNPSLTTHWCCRGSGGRARLGTRGLWEKGDMKPEVGNALPAAQR